MKSIKLKWKGEEVTIKEDRAFEVADAVEEVITFGELVQMRAGGGNIRFTKIAKAYAAMLTEAGLPVSAREVHSEIMAMVRNAEKAEKLSMALEAIDWLLVILMDGAPEAEGEGDTEGNGQAPAS
jgi:hypothetical protein